MRFFFSVLFSVLFGISFLGTPVQAAGDIISPSLLHYRVEPGEEFSFDLSLKSEKGGTYRVQIWEVVVENGVSSMKKAEQSPLKTSEEVYQFERGEEKYVPVQVSVPSDSDFFDAAYAVAFRPDTDAFHAYELSSVVVLGVGEVPSYGGELSLQGFEEDGESAGNFRSYRFAFKNTEERLFTARPVFLLYYKDHQAFERREGKVRVFFSGVNDEMAFYNYEEVLMFEDFERAELQMESPDGQLVVSQDVALPSRGEWVSQDWEDSSLQPFRERRKYAFLYHPIFRVSALLIGLTIIVGSFFLKKKES